MSYLVTGGTGLIGAHTVRLLTQQGEQVVAYDLVPDTHLLENLIEKENMDQVQVIHGDIIDQHKLIHTCQEYAVEKILHTAALLSSATSTNPLLAVRVNCEGTLNVLEAARILHLKRVVLASSLDVFGRLPERYRQEYVPNDAPHYPYRLYGACKSFNKTCARIYFDEYGVDSIGIRFPRIYGEGQRRGAAREIAEELFVKPALGKPGKVPFGDDPFDWLYADDAARVMTMASQVFSTKTRTFTVTAGDVRSFTEVVAYVKHSIPDADITLLPGRRSSYTRKFDTTPLREEIGFQPEWTVEEGVKKVIDYLQRHHETKMGEE
jgi:UDP-glucose 4-epimerase